MATVNAQHRVAIFCDAALLMLRAIAAAAAEDRRSLMTILMTKDCVDEDEDEAIARCDPSVDAAMRFCARSFCTPFSSIPHSHTCTERYANNTLQLLRRPTLPGTKWRDSANAKLLCKSTNNNRVRQLLCTERYYADFLTQTSINRSDALEINKTDKPVLQSDAAQQNECTDDAMR